MKVNEVVVSRLKIEHLRETLGVGVPSPRLSWQVKTEAQNWQQVAYEIIRPGRNGPMHESSGRIESGQSRFVPWPFEPLVSRQRISLKVRVWGNDGSESAWSDPLRVEMGLLAPDDWSAQFITPAWAEDTSQANPAPYLRHEFSLRDTPVSARLYITALGVYEAEINGRRVGDQLLAPGWTVYDKRLRYQTFDVTEVLSAGTNAIGAIVADGWYRGRFGFAGGRRNIWGDRLALLAQLEVTYADGSSERIITDGSWQATTGPIQMACLYDGERYDARLEQPGWSKPGFAAASWSAVASIEQDLSVLIAPPGPPVRRQETLAPVTISQSPAGKTLIDFGQNLVGWLRIRVQREAGQTITLRHAEVLENEELGTRPLRIAEATDTYTLRGDGVEVWEPRFTFHGFRYAEISGWPGELKADDIEAVVVHSDMERAGWFECSDPLVNRLHENVVWGMRGNFLDVPTDCPQRDERLGWTTGVCPNRRLHLRRGRFPLLLAGRPGSGSDERGRRRAANRAQHPG
ncbi:MAG: family 78 glycoside hydrolase catalytic domain [Anaerolineales bacterium]|nr:family 78 glycoside hydrolase catalytic domain [Anaerolineales bacterium]